MRTIKALIVAIVSGLLSGCWNVSRLPPPQRECWSNPEQLSERVRSLPGVAEHQVLEKAERLLRLTWREDVKIIRSSHRLTAEVRRDHSFYLLLVAYRGIVDESWTIATRPEPDGTGVCVQLQGQYLTDTFALGAEPITSLIYPATMKVQTHGHFLPRAQPIAVGFDTFWARLDYLLGLKQGWTACRSSGPRRNETYGRTEFDPLCHSLADDSGQPPAQVIERP